MTKTFFPELPTLSDWVVSKVLSHKTMTRIRDAVTRHEPFNPILKLGVLSTEEFLLDLDRLTCRQFRLKYGQAVWDKIRDL